MWGIIASVLSHGKEDSKTSKAWKSSTIESVEKSTKRKEGGSGHSVENRLIQLAMTAPQGVGDGQLHYTSENNYYSVSVKFRLDGFTRVRMALVSI